MKKLKRLLRCRNKSGFTLVEVVISCALLGILVLGITGFIVPVMSSVRDSEKNARASLVAETMDTYINRTIRNASFVKIFTNVPYTQLNTLAGDDNIAGNLGNNGDMVKFLAEGSNKDIYEIKCMSLRWSSDTAENVFKYMLYNERLNETNYSILATEGITNPLSSTNSYPIFEQCFYGDFFPEIAVEQLKGNVESPDTTKPQNPDGTYPTKTEEKEVPAIKFTNDVYTIDPIDKTKHLILEGVGYTEFINIRSKATNPNDKLKFFGVEDKGAAENDHGATVIYYLQRKSTYTMST